MPLPSEGQRCNGQRWWRGFRGTKGGRRQHGKTPMNNQTQNAQTKAIANQLKLTPAQRRILHEEVTGRGYGYQEILEIAKELFGK